MMSRMRLGAHKSIIWTSVESGLGVKVLSTHWAKNIENFERVRIEFTKEFEWSSYFSPK